jgi:anthranilate phosphoribosyltransferase
MDELSISDITHCAFVERGSFNEFTFDPREYGFDLYDKEEIVGGDALENGKITRGILDGTITGAKKDIVLINAAAALLVDQKVNSTEEGVEMAREIIESKKAIEKLEQIIKVSNELV